MQQREQFGQKIAEFQAVRHRLARSAIDIEAARLLTYNAARLHDAGQPFVREAAMAKWFASDVAERVASECLELYGGVGFTKECPAEKFLRDAKIGKIYEGTSFVQLDTIAKSAVLTGPARPSRRRARLRLPRVSRAAGDARAGRNALPRGASVSRRRCCACWRSGSRRISRVRSTRR